MDCPPVSSGGGSEVPEALLEPGVWGGAHREPVVKVGGAPGARPGRGEAGRRGSGIGSWRGSGAFENGVRTTKAQPAPLELVQLFLKSLDKSTVGVSLLQMRKLMPGYSM